MVTSLWVPRTEVHTSCRNNTEEVVTVGQGEIGKAVPGWTAEKGKDRHLAGKQVHERAK